ncbi:unnamed protein product [Penicillium salamii]|uniref:Uncharacterized protein n=1 Tax=Penicillium salamii TaxID=1612424 RepID=A0A9W4NNA5_9EURO|nr:unnamed protein product [Penicillium salamii]CAG8138804.1 unnamed protein product [Penicillium salamii]CAG8155965.1 unnamed protein product [Penicillium salamii]CAG8157997.1 unnamed protein product [Penicillium salamii]CAG8257623.1 unnamed protein product [Penicillium salamii]
MARTKFTGSESAPASDSSIKSEATTRETHPPQADRDGPPTPSQAAISKAPGKGRINKLKGAKFPKEVLIQWTKRLTMRISPGLPVSTLQRPA